MLNMVFLPLVTFLISPFVLWIHSMVGVVGLVEDGALRGAIVCNNDSWVTSKRRRETVWDNWTVGHFGSKKQISNIVDFQLSKWPSTKKNSKNISLIFQGPLFTTLHFFVNGNSFLHIYTYVYYTYDEK